MMDSRNLRTVSKPSSQYDSTTRSSRKVDFYGFYNFVGYVDSRRRPFVDFSRKETWKEELEDDRRIHSRSFRKTGT